MTNISDKYKDFIRPELGGLLQVMRFDKVYHKGIADKLYYLNDDGEEQEVLDFIGGYGASLFGHNNEELSAVAFDFLSAS